MTSLDNGQSKVCKSILINLLHKEIGWSFDELSTLSCQYTKNECLFSKKKKKNLCEFTNYSVYYSLHTHLTLAQVLSYISVIHRIREKDCY